MRETKKTTAAAAEIVLVHLSPFEGAVMTLSLPLHGGGN